MHDCGRDCLRSGLIGTGRGDGVGAGTEEDQANHCKTYDVGTRKTCTRRFAACFRRPAILSAGALFGSGSFSGRLRLLTG